MAQKTTMFFLGATGFIGGAVLQLYLNDPSFDIAALVRDAGKAKKLTDEFGVRTTVGSMDDLDLLAEEASKADVVVNVAIQWHLPGMQAILKGIKARYDKTGTKPILVHTSGSGAVVTDNALGEFASDKVYVDTDLAQMRNLPAEHIHRLCDDAILSADVEGGYVRAYTIMPSWVWGVLKGPLADAAISHRTPLAAETLLRASIARGQGGVIGKGLNVWSRIEVHEQAQLHQLVISAALKDSTFLHGLEGLYFGENGEGTVIDTARAYTTVLYAAGKSRTAVPEPFTEDDLEKLVGRPARYVGASSRVRADRGRALGWKPVLGTEAFLANLKAEVDAVLAAA